MDNNIRPDKLKEQIDKIKIDLPNISIPTMGIIPEDNKIKINNNDFWLKNEVKEDQHVE